MIQPVGSRKAKEGKWEIKKLKQETRSIAEGPRDALCQMTYRHVLYNSCTRNGICKGLPLPLNDSECHLRPSKISLPTSRLP